MSAAIELKSVEKTFGAGSEAVHAFGPADLDIKPGEFVSLLGPSGCGKSTLMLMIAGLLGAKRRATSWSMVCPSTGRRPISALCSRTTR